MLMDGLINFQNGFKQYIQFYIFLPKEGLVNTHTGYAQAYPVYT